MGLFALSWVNITLGLVLPYLSELLVPQVSVYVLASEGAGFKHVT